LDALVDERLRPSPIAFIGDGPAKPQLGFGSAPLVAEFAIECERLLGPFAPCRSISTQARHRRRRVENFCAGCRRTLVRAQDALETSSPLSEMAPVPPELPHSCC